MVGVGVVLGELWVEIGVDACEVHEFVPVLVFGVHFVEADRQAAGIAGLLLFALIDELDQFSQAEGLARAFEGRGEDRGILIGDGSVDWGGGSGDGDAFGGELRLEHVVASASGFREAVGCEADTHARLGVIGSVDGVGRKRELRHLGCYENGRNWREVVDERSLELPGVIARELRADCRRVWPPSQEGGATA